MAQKDDRTCVDRGRKVIYSELCKKFKFNHSNKLYMHEPESVLELEIHKILLAFEIQIDHQIPEGNKTLYHLTKMNK